MSVNQVVVTLAAARSAGRVGTVVSAGVVTTRAALAGETLPAPSRAITVMLYDVVGERPVTTKVRAVIVEPNSEPSRKTLFPAIPPDAPVAAVHVNVREVALIAVVLIVAGAVNAA